MSSGADFATPWSPAPKGLEGVIVADTMISKIDGKGGKLIYRGYDISDLAGKVPFESVAFLLWVGHLPNPEELDTFRDNLAAHRHIPKEVRDFVETAPKNAEPLSVLRSAVSIMGLVPKEKDSILEDGIALAARLPTINAYYQHVRNSESIIEPRKDLGHAANYIYMLTGKVPEEQKEKALDSYFTLLADHGMNSSTFSARVTISTLTDVYSAIVAAIGTLKGPLHGGAPSKVWEMLMDVGDAQNARPWLLSRLEKKERIMGFGHRIYRTEDPRSKILKELARQNAAQKIFSLAETVESEARSLLSAEHPERPLDTNVEFYSSLVLDSVGIPIDMFTPTFASARIFGWIAQIMEQLADNKLFRPDSRYIGPLGLKVR
ncbi:MAG: citrate/2-methylcitrate synthase [Nitrososphaerales archaeon]